jgi:hypothetical protein
MTAQPVGNSTRLYGAPSTVDGEEYIIARTGYAPKKASPLGTFAGGNLFAARGVWPTNMATADIQNYQLIDANGTTRDPPNQQAITVNSVESGDRVSVFRTTAGEIDKTIYTSHNTNNTSGLDTFETIEDIATDTPTAGVLRVVDTGAGTEQRYTYTSWSGKIFSGVSPVLVTTYANDDTAYVPFIDEEATGTEVDVTVIYTSNRSVLTRVRKKGIIPFQVAGTFGSTGLTVAAIRTTDSIVT